MTKQLTEVVNLSKKLFEIKDVVEIEIPEGATHYSGDWGKFSTSFDDSYISNYDKIRTNPDFQFWKMLYQPSCNTYYWMCWRYSEFDKKIGWRIDAAFYNELKTPDYLKEIPYDTEVSR
jgi:hypothetical protein